VILANLFRKIKSNAFLFVFSAERRAQLARSRSRQDVFKATPEIVREIDFDDASDSPISKRKSQGTTPSPCKSSHSTGSAGSSSQENSSVDSEAEALLARLKAL
jgi:hypothetical protein